MILLRVYLLRREIFSIVMEGILLTGIKYLVVHQVPARIDRKELLSRVGLRVTVGALEP